jgi:Zn-dependent protease with chaperone function
MQAGNFQVTLTGVRTRPQDESALHAQLQKRFRLTPEQIGRMLAGRNVVKRGIDETTAAALAKVLADIGLEALVENATVIAPASPPRPATIKPASAAPPPAKPVASKPAAVKAEPSRANQPDTTALEALLALDGQRLPRPKTGALYVMSLLMVTLTCLAIPAFYVALTGAIAYGWVWFLTHYHHFMPRNIYAVIFGYAVPGTVGAVLLVFLLRPLFQRRGKAPANVRLDPQQEAGFVSGVHALCRAIGVSPPREIWLTHDANASVHYRTRWLSLVTGHKVLTIGMSLVAGLTARQFIGVLAHEFGHFAQRAGMACSFIVNSVNRWLEHRAYGFDNWEQSLDEWTDAHEGDENSIASFMMICAVACLFAIGAIRRLMGALFTVSLRVSGYMSRQMEFDADRYEALLAGSSMFRSTARTLRALTHSAREVNAANIEAWRDRRLLRDLPDAVGAFAGEFDAKRLAGIDAEMTEDTTTRYWDSHPPDVERVQNAESQRAPGIYLLDSPAASLFRDSGTWSRRVTSLFYREQGVQYLPENLCPRDEVLGRIRSASDRSDHLERYFNGQFRVWPVLPLDAGNAAPSLGWQQCIDELRRRSPDIAKLWKQAHEAHGRRALLMTAVRLQVSSKELGIPGANRLIAEMETELSNFAGQNPGLEKPLAESLELYARRIAHAIEAMPETQRARATQLATAVTGLGSLAPIAAELELVAGAMRNFATIAENNEGKMPGGFELLEKNFADLAARLIHKADDLRQPVAAGDSIGGFLRSRCPQLADAGVEPGAYARAAWPAVEAFQSLYLLALGELVQACAAVEQAKGIRPIKLT